MKSESTATRDEICYCRKNPCVCFKHDAACESELTSHGYTPCRCHERAAETASQPSVGRPRLD